MSAKTKGLLVFGVLGAAVWLQIGGAQEAKNRYDYWARFKPGTFVAFRIRTKGIGADQEILRTFTVKRVTPDFVLIEYRETLSPGAKPTAANPAVLLAGTLEFPAHEIPGRNADLFGGQLNFNSFRAWEDEDGAGIDKDVEELTVRGTKISASRTRVHFRSSAVSTTITIWRSEAVPGTIAKGLREMRLKDEVPLREEIIVVDFRAETADPAEIARLRAERKPATVEETGWEFVDIHFRFMKDFESTSKTLKALIEALGRLVPNSPETDWAAVSKEWARYQAASQAMRDHLSEDRKRVEARLDPAEFVKLDPFLKPAGELADFHTRHADVLQNLSTFAENPPPPEKIGSLLEELSGFFAAFQAAHKRAQAEFKKLGSITIKSIR